jgi:hypothetical protein
MALKYEVEVNKGRLSAMGLSASLNMRAGKGWRLAHIFEQHGNTVLIFEQSP